MSRFAQTWQTAKRALDFISPPPLGHAEIQAFRFIQWPMDGGDVPNRDWCRHIDPKSRGIRVVGGMDGVIAVKEAVGFGKGFLNGDGVHVDAEALALATPSELELECFHGLLSFGRFSAPPAEKLFIEGL